MKPRALTAAVLATLLAVIGCGVGSGVQEERIVVDSSNDPMAEPEALLRSYSEGQPFGSEVEGFDAVVTAVREKNPGKADILEEGFAELKSTAPAGRRAKAAEILGKLNNPVP